QQILLSTLQLERRIAELLDSHDMSCIKKPDGECFVLSPLAFWDYDQASLVSDAHILDTLSLSRNVSIAGITVTPHMVLAERRATDPLSAEFDSAMFLAVSYFFPDTDCLGKTGHLAFLRVLESATLGEELVIQAQEPTLLALEVNFLSSSFVRTCRCSRL